MKRTWLLLVVLVGGMAQATPGQTNRVEPPVVPNDFRRLLTQAENSAGDDRMNALRQLADYDDPLMIDPLIACAGDTNAAIRLSALKMLQRFNEPRVREVLIRACADPAVGIQAAMVKALGASRDVRLMEHLLAAVLSEQEYVRAAGMAALSDLRATVDRPSFSGELDRLVQRQGVVTGSAAVVSVSVEVWRKLLQSPNRLDRRYAAILLSWLRDPPQVAPLLDALRDHDARVCETARLALDEVDDPRAAPVFLSRLATSTNFVEWIPCIRAVGRMRETNAVPALTNLARQADLNVRYAAIQALTDIGDARMLPVMLGLLKDPDPQSRLLALSAVGVLNDPRSVDALIEMMDGADQNLSSKIGRQLMRITGVTFDANPKAWRSWWRSQRLHQDPRFRLKWHTTIAVKVLLLLALIPLWRAKQQAGLCAVVYAAAALGLGAWCGLRGGQLVQTAVIAALGSFIYYWLLSRCRDNRPLWILIAVVGLGIAFK